MPYLRIDLVGPIDADTRRRLLVETAQLFADLIESDIARVRTVVHEIPADAFAVGGVPCSESGVQAPYITLDLFEGRPDAQHRALCEQIPRSVAGILGCPLEGVRLRVNEVFPGGWSIGGVQASLKRQAEIDARAERRAQEQQQQ
jgi:phenylpyruvate tautomerase PptA (4-oxalocrotonate tautomerase family)